MDTIKIAVIFASRGLCFSETADELLQNLQGFDYDIFFSHEQPIPDCFEGPTREALKGSYTHVWYAEDDMKLPTGILKAMLAADVPVATCDYPVNKKGQGATFKDGEGRVIYSGTGCLLVKRAVFDKISKPYFRTDIRWSATNYGDFIRLMAMRVDNPTLEGYGLHDVNFGIKLWQAGIPISEIAQIGQRKLVKLGQAGSNNGAHYIEEWVKVSPNVLLKKFRGMPKQEIGKLVSVKVKDGELNVTPEKANKLIESGAAAAIPKQSVSVDLNGVDI